MVLEARRTYFGRLAPLGLAIVAAGAIWWLMGVLPDSAVSWPSNTFKGYFCGIVLLSAALWNAIFPIGTAPVLIVDSAGIFDRRVMKRPVSWEEVVSWAEPPTSRGNAVELMVSVPDALAKWEITRTFESWDKAGSALIALRWLDHAPENIKAAIAARIGDTTRRQSPMAKTSI